ncbi:MAG: hybrid sensor histidine kinase/response regulator [Leptolyngbyaceae bacterium]|nr:hybrid sensor histidine kinase/response regulator [Leptolyngbyaceae bacterium]
MKRASVLVVDDEPNNFEVIEAFLHHQPYDLHYVSNGADALKSLESVQPDVILLDVMMPGLDGFEVCRRIKATEPWNTIPIIMVTALSTKKDLARCIEIGADDFVGKPINSVELRARVQSMLRIRAQWLNIQNFSHIQEETIHTLEQTLNELRGGLVSCLSHELNTPLFGVIGAIDFLKEQFNEQDAQDVWEMLKIAEQSTERLERLIARLITYLELELSRNPPSLVASVPTHFSQGAIAQNLKTQAQNTDRCEDLVLDIEEASIVLAERYVFFILHELLDNALKFSTPGTPITVTSKRLNGELVLTIHDQGRGMTDDQIQQVGAFKQFERQAFEQQGMGLGLKLVRSIAAQGGCRFLITSHYQKETTVTVAFPVAQDED